MGPIKMNKRVTESRSCPEPAKECGVKNDKKKHRCRTEDQVLPRTVAKDSGITNDWCKERRVKIVIGECREYC